MIKLRGCEVLWLFWPYLSEEEAIRDVLRLSRGMTYKAAMAKLPLGGGKAVIIGDAKSQKTPELLKAFGRFVDQLQGQYITAEDVGMRVEDMKIVRSVIPSPTLNDSFTNLRAPRCSCT